MRSIAFAEGSPLLGPVHILDLDKNGFIKPHIDSVKVGFQGRRAADIVFQGQCCLFVFHNEDLNHRYK